MKKIIDKIDIELMKAINKKGFIYLKELRSKKYYEDYVIMKRVTKLTLLNLLVIERTGREKRIWLSEDGATTLKIFQNVD